MAKKEIESEVKDTQAVVTTDDSNVKKDKDVKSKDKDKKDKKSKKKDPNKKGVSQKSKELYSELKKVSWPSFGKVVKSTCVVLLVVTVCTLLLFGADRLFFWLFGLLMG